MKNLINKFKQLKTWQKVLSVLFMLFIIGLCIPKGMRTTKAKSVAWTEMDEAQKTEWLANIKDNLKAGEIGVQIDMEVKKQLKYPEEADIKLIDALLHPVIIKKGEPNFMFTGTAIGKNTFGVKIRFNWIAEAEIKPESQKVTSVLVTEE